LCRRGRFHPNAAPVKFSIFVGFNCNVPAVRDVPPYQSLITNHFSPLPTFSAFSVFPALSALSALPLPPDPPHHRVIVHRYDIADAVRLPTGTRKPGQLVWLESIVNRDFFASGDRAGTYDQRDTFPVFKMRRGITRIVEETAELVAGRTVQHPSVRQLEQISVTSR
jgi:hypothetical protein